jgi:hypothetical protein
MNTEYDDIRSRIPEPPKWWDEFAVPRYDAFSPMLTANIYAREVALLLIACQACRTEFPVCMSAGRELADAIKAGSLHYGDPPNVRCCPAGPSTNCLDLRVLEYWRRDDRLNWQRDGALEIDLSDAPE